MSEDQELPQNLENNPTKNLGKLKARLANAKPFDTSELLAEKGEESKKTKVNAFGEIEDQP